MSYLYGHFMAVSRDTIPRSSARPLDRRRGGPQTIVSWPYIYTLIPGDHMSRPHLKIDTSSKLLLDFNVIDFKLKGFA